MFHENKATTPKTSKKRITLTTQAKRSHVENFERSDQTMSTYCRAHGIAISTFSTWVAKYGVKEPPSFVPVQVCDEPEESIRITQQAPTCLTHIEIHRGELKIVFPVMSDIALTIEIIKGIFTCNSF